MKSIETIRKQIVAGKIRLTAHALRRILERNISRTEIQQVGTNALIIEDYPQDKYSPSCLILGFTNVMRPLHLQVSRLDSEYVKIITIYEPSKDKWIDKYSQRR